ncbi:hypothetical protein RCL1_005656 [Eukaryota sp. TZLM3-RCL]
MFVAAILPLDGVFKEQPGFCYVVNNPRDFSSSYCLPLLVLEMNRPEIPSQQVQYKPVEIPTPVHFESHSVVDVDPTSTLSCVARWQWQDDSGWKPYTEDISRLIESRWALFNEGEAVDSFVAGRIVRLRDDVPQDYLINFKTMKQTNMKTNYLRSIKREVVNIDVSKNSTWEYFDQGVWNKYDLYVQKTIEDRYRHYVSTQDSAIVKLTFPGRPELYMLDFAAATQKNLTTNTVRKIRRLESSEQVPDVVITFPVPLNVTCDVKAIKKVHEAILQMINLASPTCLSTVSSNSIDFSFDNSHQCFTLRVPDELHNISSLLAAVVFRSLKEQNIVVLSTNDQETNSVANRNPRLTKLLSGITPSLDALSRETLFEYLSHVLLFECNCIIYGGYVRDYLIRNVSASDLDVCCPTENLDETVDLFVSHVESAQANFIIDGPSSPNSVCKRVDVTCGSYKVQVDFSIPGSSRMIEGAAPPFVEADVSNLQVSKASYISFREPEASKNTDLATVITHCMNQEFVFYYDLNQAPQMKYRLERRVKKGWVCLSAIPEHCQDVFNGRRHLYRPIV